MTLFKTPASQGTLNPPQQDVPASGAPPRRRPHSLLQTAVLGSMLAVAALAGEASAEDKDDADRLLSVAFESRRVVKVEAGNFYFKKGQLAPIHTHAAPAIGYIAKGAILYQVEGETPQLLKKGDAFYEPVGRRIVHFDNASTTEDAIFVDFNLQRDGEPFIVFENPPTEAIDRRALPTATLDGTNVHGVEGYTYTIQPDGSEKLDSHQQLLGYVAEGIVELRAEGKGKQRIKAGESFYQPIGDSSTVLFNRSPRLPAKVIVFSLHKS